MVGTERRRCCSDVGEETARGEEWEEFWTGNIWTGPLGLGHYINQQNGQGKASASATSSLSLACPHFAPRNLEQVDWTVGAELRSFWLLRGQSVGSIAQVAFLAAYRNHQSFTVGAPLRHHHHSDVNNVPVSGEGSVAAFEHVRLSPLMLTNGGPKRGHWGRDIKCN